MTGDRASAGPLESSTDTTTDRTTDTTSGGRPRVTVGVLAVQGDVREHLDALRECGAHAVPVRRASELAEVDGLVLPGGESTTIDRLLRAFDLADPLRRRIAEGMPVYGSCAGMILLADRLVESHAGQQTLGGMDVLVRRNAFGRQVDSFEADLDVAADLGGADGSRPEEDEERRPLTAVFIRAPWVEELGEDVEVLASVEVDGVDRPVAVRQGRLLATSFHPEVTGDLRVHAMFVRMVRESRDAS
ncbi:pyridoxal 5'-phosphate synthase glutaminase subunit PdxT [Mobilicoccus sp.]|uniref:pyridoxal 5'-phosphate synthase glutaminase subunit PdxT n=1 Tax=Mobilicoccus sp. TaxID=2034349 RepID=UPI0028AB3C63|nr:pyridoxal 5'-phosphate synthase glutaminase subunit PdxT [Mobilicoccus sp.]